MTLHMVNRRLTGHTSIEMHKEEVEWVQHSWGLKRDVVR